MLLKHTHRDTSLALFRLCFVCSLAKFISAISTALE